MRVSAHFGLWILFLFVLGVFCALGLAMALMIALAEGVAI